MLRRVSSNPDRKSKLFYPSYFYNLLGVITKKGGLLSFLSVGGRRPGALRRLCVPYLLLSSLFRQFKLKIFVLCFTGKGLVCLSAQGGVRKALGHKSVVSTKMA